MTPSTPTKDAPAATAETPEAAGLSKQAQFSTYSEDDEANKLAAEQNPPDGKHVKQELGKPSEGPVKAFGSS